MPAILATFTVLLMLAVLIHRALGRPATDLTALLKVCGWLTITFIALSHGPETIAATENLIKPLLESGPSG